MDLSTWFEIQRGRISDSASLQQDIRQHQWANAPKRLDKGERRAHGEYKTHGPNGYCPIKAGYLAIRLLYV